MPGHGFQGRPGAETFHQEKITLLSKDLHARTVIALALQRGLTILPLLI